ncbi:MAG: hypothetical protein HY300_00160, partial [Verrucomicrobia bacterium]|nr:hypothetical protein [Verrucomicrobiota bacterium]
RRLIHWKRALLWHTVGFAVLVTLTWCDQFFDLMFRLFGHDHSPAALDEAIFKSVVLVLIWGISAFEIYRIVSRLSYLENFLHVCAWCHKIEQQNNWMSIEEHFKKQTGAKVSHGLCPECARKLQAGYGVAPDSSEHA